MGCMINVVAFLYSLGEINEIYNQALRRYVSKALKPYEY